MNAIAPIQLGSATPIPSAIVISASTTTLSSVGATLQLTVTATYPDGTSKNVTAAVDGTGYTISSPATATITASGLVTAKASGTVVISAINDGALGLIQLHVVLTGDTDGDGIPDDVEIANGLNPNNPVDAQEDPDGDGLTNFQELMIYGTNPLLADTDGDGISDGDEVSGKLGFVTNPLLADSDGDGVRDLLEIQSGSDPNDRNSLNLAQALQSLQVNPSVVVLTVNSILGTASQQLIVTGHLKDGTTIDLTSTARGTSYNSSDLTVVNFGSPDGRIFAGNDGTATVTIANNTFSATVQVTVQTFTPTALSSLSIPGFANNVDVSGNFAYVAAGAAGLQIVDVSNHLLPRIVGALDTPGNANDVKVVGKLAFIADGSSGLQIIDVSDPTAPALVGSIDTPGDATDLVVVGNRAYIADGVGGLQIIDVSVPGNPTTLGVVGTSGRVVSLKGIPIAAIDQALVASISTAGIAKGVDVQGTMAVIAEGTSGLEVVDVSDPTNPVVIGSVSTGDARDVIWRGNFAFVADFASSFTAVDLTDPRHPQVTGSTPPNTGGRLMGVAVLGQFAFGADVFFVNGVPIIDVSSPANPVPRAILDFSSFSDDNGTGIAADSAYVYLTADQSGGENGTFGASHLYIGQYQSITDTSGVAPVVQVTSPGANTQVIEGETITITADATDDIAVANVNFNVNGALVGSDGSEPYQASFIVPLGVPSLTIQAQATDFGGNVGSSLPISVIVIPDPLTTVIGQILGTNGLPVQGATATVFNTFIGVTDANGMFLIDGVPTISGNITVKATFSPGGIPQFGTSTSVPAVRGGITAVGTIQLIERITLLIVAGDPFPPVNELMATGLFEQVDVFDNTSGTPPINQLSKYDVVLCYSDFVPADRSALGDVLADYIDQGGRLLLATGLFSDPWSVLGRITQPNYSPMVNVGVNGDVGSQLTPTLPVDAIFVGIDLSLVSYLHNLNWAHTQLSPNAKSLATDGAGTIMIARNQQGNIIGLNFLPASGLGNSQEFYKLLAQTILSLF